MKIMKLVLSLLMVTLSFDINKELFGKTEPVIFTDAKTASVPCPKLPQKFDADGIQVCPEIDTPWAVMRCAISQARTFHKPSMPEKKNMNQMVIALKEGRTAEAKTFAANNGLVMCRTTKYDKQKNIIDKYLLIYTRPGVSTYSGPFLMYREINAVPLILQTPHDLVDNTHSAVKEAFTQTRSLALMSNGQKKDIAEDKSMCAGRKISDSAHSLQNLHWTLHVSLTNNFPEAKVFQIHGMKGPGCICVNSLSKTDKDKFMYAVTSSISRYFSDRDTVFKGRLRSCATGTLLNHQSQCNFNKAWIQGRHLTGSTSNTECKTGSKDLDRFVGCEFDVNLMKPSVFVGIFRDLEKNYFSEKSVSYSSRIVSDDSIYDEFIDPSDKDADIDTEFEDGGSLYDE